MAQEHFEGQRNEAGGVKAFSLREGDVHLLPQGQSLIVDPLRDLFILVDWQLQRVLAIYSVVSEEQFDLVLMLLVAWPSYVPYLHLLRLLAIQLTSDDVEDLERMNARERQGESEARRTQAEQARDRVSPQLQTLRDELAACKPILNALGLDICAVPDFGPLLVRYVSRKKVVPVAGEAGGREQ